MKKLFLVGALAASMAFSSSALAAVDYGQNENLTVSYDGESTVSVTTNLSTYAGDQMTVLVLNNDDGSVEATDIMYIDQAAAPTAAEWENGTKIFQNMGLLMPTEKDDEGKDVPLATLPVGTYTVKVGGTNLDSTSLLKATIVVSEDAGETVVTDVIQVGDVNNVGGADATDALAIIAYVANSANDGASTNKHAINKVLKISETENYQVGDVNNIGGADATDALAIIAYVANSANDGASTNKYAINQEITYIVEE